MLQRAIDAAKLIEQGKVMMLYGPRQVGKTTLIQDFLSKTTFKYRYDTGDNLILAKKLAECSYESTDDHVDGFELIVIDEAQKIENIGNALKLMVDRHPDKYFIATGSSSFELANRTDESLTGRKNLYTLYPLAQCEMSMTASHSQLRHDLANYLIYGSYPEVLMKKSRLDKEKVIKSITSSYLIKDILEFNRIKNSLTIYKLLQLLAFQVGAEVSTSELASKLSVDVKTVVHYLDLLQKSFVIFPLYGFSRNLRNEVNKMNKYYFFDLGVRNALILNFNQLEDRADIGQLWENFLMIERIKKHNYSNFSTNYYFWRTYEQQEIDLIEEHSGKLFGYEFKWQNQSSKPPKLWIGTYENASFAEINSDNYLDFIL